MLGVGLDNWQDHYFQTKTDVQQETRKTHNDYLQILAETGIRGGEICGLRLADLDLENALIHVHQSVWRGQIQTVKSRKGNRRFPISAELVALLPRAQRQLVPHSGHMPFWEAPEVFFSSVDSFLAAPVGAVRQFV